MSTDQFDCIVVGGGMIGLASACSLSKLGLSVALIETQKPKLRWPKDSHALRVSAINNESEALLTDIGVWDDIQKLTTPYQNMFVWDENSTGEIAFSAEDAQMPHLGCLVENRVIVRALWKAITDTVTLFCPDTLETLTREDESWILELGSGKKIETKLVVAADGARSRIRDSVKIKTNPVFYNQHGLVATIKTEHPHESTAWQCFLTTGPLAFLPLQDSHLSSIVWSCPPEEAKRLIDLPEAEFNQTLSHAFDNKLGQCSLIGDRASFPLYHHHADTYSTEGLTLIGDAAHSIHPLAGLGANLGFHDVKCLSNQIKMALDKKRPYYTHTILKKFEREARCKNEMTSQMMTALNALFSNNTSALSCIRGIGINFINRQNILKNFFVKMAGDHS